MPGRYWPVVLWSVPVLSAWVVAAKLLGEDCPPDAYLCVFDEGFYLMLLALPTLVVWLIGVAVISILGSKRRRGQRRDRKPPPRASYY